MQWSSAIRAEAGPVIVHRDRLRAGRKRGYRSQPLSVPRLSSAVLSLIGLVLGFSAYLSIHLVYRSGSCGAPLAQLEATQATLREQVVMTESALATAREKTIVAEETFTET